MHFSTDSLIDFVLFSGSRLVDSNGTVATERLSHSLPGSPADRRPNFPDVVGSGESLVGRVNFLFALSCYIPTVWQD